jgi:transcription initiation factor TFIID subunit 8
MRNFLGQVQKSMSSARRTETVSTDWVYALNSNGITGSSLLDQHLDTGEIPPSLLQPSFAPPEPAEQAPPDLEGLLGPGLSGKAEKDSKPYIPSHFPPFPSKHTWKATPVFTERENDPRKIREKATEEGILAEQSLRKLMVAQKKGLQKTNDRVGKRKRSKRMVESDRLWEVAMKEVRDDEDARAEAINRFEDDMDEETWHNDSQVPTKAKSSLDRKVNLEGVHVNYDQKFWRKSARGS